MSYYRDGDLYMFDEFQTGQVPEHRRPVMDTLFDTFVAIRDDEAEHVKTMVACQRPETQEEILSPHGSTLTNALEPKVVLTGMETAETKVEEKINAE